ncbi:MAG: fumarylacetoacetate hydrolase family protein [Gammaproteobacteria bacterium]|nr:fumarylacetoacetate hydrolase family protein [Gammaproteobacteria bacterium]
MKLITFDAGIGPRAGAILPGDEFALDLAKAATILDAEEAGQFVSMQTLIEGGPESLQTVHALLDKAPEEAIIDMRSLKLLSPLPAPVQMRDFLCFETHLVQAFEAGIRIRAAQSEDPEKTEAALRTSGRFDVPQIWYQQPVYYKCNRFAVIGTGEDIVWPGYSTVMDYELEIAAVIGRRGKDIPADKAVDHVFGFTIFNDFSARDAQAVEMEGMLGPAKGKDFDGANVLGPCITTIDEIGDPYDLDMIASVNGEEWSRGNTSSMHWKFEDIISHVSRSETIYPGEILGSGTVGNGCGLELMRFLQDGDVVELEIEKIGRIQNRVIRQRSRD